MGIESLKSPKPVSGPRIGVVLSSGGVRGVYAHAGFLLAIECLPVPIVAAADLFRAAGKPSGETCFVAGLRIWF